MYPPYGVVSKDYQENVAGEILANTIWNDVVVNTTYKIYDTRAIEKKLIKLYFDVEGIIAVWVHIYDHYGNPIYWETWVCITASEMLI